MSYMAMCYPKRTKCSKKVPQSRRGCLRSIQRRRSEDNDDSTDDSDNHLLIPDIPLQHLLERMTSTEIQRIDVNSVCTPDGSSSSRRTNTSGVDRTTQTDSSAIHIHRYQDIFNPIVCTHCNMLPPLAKCLNNQIQIMNGTVYFMQSCLKSNNASLKMLSHLLNYISAQFKLALLQNHYPGGLDKSQVSSGLLQTAQTWANAGVCGGLCACAVGGTFD